MSQRIIDHALVAVIIVDGERYLLVEESKPGRERTYNVPGGKIKADETIAEAAVREVKEETGYDVELEGVVGMYQTITDGYNFAGPVYAGEITGGDAAVSGEHPSQKWLTLDEIDELYRQGKIFSHYIPDAIRHLRSRGPLPLDIVTSLHK